jgi:diguanylate cyclase (GGDEF)-like protein/putative nucleotidyltransferase with HDIG domain
MKDNAKDRLIWLACGILLVAWVVAYSANYGIRNLWATLPNGGGSLVQQYSVLAYFAVVVLTALVLAWVFYSASMAEARKQAEGERRFRRDLEEVHRGTLQALTMALDMRDGETCGHSRRVMGYSLAIGRQMGLNEEETQTLAWGALLHDLGKIGIRDSTLLKPGPLTIEERAEMQQHVVLGYEMVQQIPFLTRTAAVLRHHHEKYDGTGYPSQLSGEAIPLLARIFAVADAFDAITSARPYRTVPRSMDEAREVIVREAGSHFCPDVARAFSAVSAAELEGIRDDSYRPIGELQGLYQAAKETHPEPDYYRDPLTGTQNRTAWEAKKAHMTLAQGTELGAVIFLDVDSLKPVNDTRGHLIGDRLLADLGARLQQVSPEAYRVGGDEFVLWCPEGRWGAGMEAQLRAMLDAFVAHWTHVFNGVDVSWGVCVASAETRSLTELLGEADRAMYAYKLAHRSGSLSGRFTIEEKATP